MLYKPVLSEEKQQSIKDKLNNFRKRIYNGEDFKVLATLYSDDIVSANNGGELGFMKRGDLFLNLKELLLSLKKMKFLRLLNLSLVFI